MLQVFRKKDSSLPDNGKPAILHLRYQQGHAAVRLGRLSQTIEIAGALAGLEPARPCGQQILSPSVALSRSV